MQVKAPYVYVYNIVYIPLNYDVIICKGMWCIKQKVRLIGSWKWGCKMDISCEDYKKKQRPGIENVKHKVIVNCFEVKEWMSNYWLCSH